LKNILFIIFLLSAKSIFADTLEVGLDQQKYQYNNLRTAALVAKPGDVILINEGIYPGGEYIENLHGTNENRIIITSKTGDSVIFRGGSQAIHFSEVSYLIISGLVFEGQTANGVNMDDGGTYETPSAHILFENCIWRNMNASGNNDQLKLSGLDYFEIKNCTFINGSAGGSQVDMVGCHYGYFHDNRFENAGSNCIQAKGGTSEIQIERNIFINGGFRSINIGGSTGLDYFRPRGVDYEAKNIKVQVNVFIGSQAPICYVGAVNCLVINNTIVNPDKWAIRILQESVDGFLPCGQNAFVNNICYVNNSNPNAIVNVGGNTAPETFLFSNNLWYNLENQNWGGPNTPANNDMAIIKQNPLFEDSGNKNYNISELSPAFMKGTGNFGLIEVPEFDFNNNRFNNPPSIGAFDKQIVSVDEKNGIDGIIIFQHSVFELIVENLSDETIEQILIYDINGSLVDSQKANNAPIIKIPVSRFSNGIYIVVLKTNNRLLSQMVNINK
jgi:hypothetical protein